MRLRRPSMAARSPIRSSSQCSTRPPPVRGRRSMRSPAKCSAACTTRKARKRSSRAARCSAACGRRPYAGAPGELGALGFGGPQLAYASADANAVCPVKAAPGATDRPLARSHLLGAGSRRLGPCRQRRQCRLVDAAGSAVSSPASMRASARPGAPGFVAGYMRSDLNVDARASSAGIDSVQLGGYAAGRLGAFNVRGGASYSLDSIDTSRAIVFPGFTDKASARFHGNVGQVFGEVGYGMAFGQVAVEPLAGLAYVHVRDGSFLESGGVAALSGASANENTGYSFARRARCDLHAAGQWHGLDSARHAAVAARLRRCDPGHGAWRSRARARRSRLPASRSRATPRWSKAASTGALPRRPSSVRSIRANSPRTRRPMRSKAPSPGISDDRGVLGFVESPPSCPALCRASTSCGLATTKTWMAGTSPAMTDERLCAAMSNDALPLSPSCPALMRCEPPLHRHARLYAGHPRLRSFANTKDVDGRNESGHDELKRTASLPSCPALSPGIHVLVALHQV